MEDIIKRIQALDEKSLFHLERFLSKLESDEDIPTHIYVDGGCVKKVGAYAWKIPDGPGDVNLIEGKTTNNIAELMAIEAAIKNTNGSIMIFSDSEYAIKCISVWSHKWKMNDWMTTNGKPVKNQELIKRIVELIDESGRNITFQHVTAHNGDKYNEMVDTMCSRAIAKKELEEVKAALDALNVSEE